MLAHVVDWPWSAPLRRIENLYGGCGSGCAGAACAVCAEGCAVCACVDTSGIAGVWAEAWAVGVATCGCVSAVGVPLVLLTAPAATVPVPFAVVAAELVAVVFGASVGIAAVAGWATLAAAAGTDVAEGGPVTRGCWTGVLAWWFTGPPASCCRLDIMLWWAGEPVAPTTPPFICALCAFLAICCMVLIAADVEADEIGVPPIGPPIAGPTAFTPAPMPPTEELIDPIDLLRADPMLGTDGAAPLVYLWQGNHNT